MIRDAFALMEGQIDPPSSVRLLTPASLVARARDEHLILALLRDNPQAAPAGCVFCAPQGDALYVGKLAVAPAWQGRGLGRRLMAEAETLARRLGLTRLRLQTRVELTGNHATFAAMGFREVGRTAHPGFARPTSVTMEKPLW